MAKHAFVVAATRGYEEPVNVLINSLRATNQADIHLLTLDLDIKPSVTVTTEIPRHDNQLLMNYIWRLKYAAGLKGYDAVCLLDADMVCVRDLKKYFDISSKAGLILVASDNTNIWYEEGYLKQYPGILDKPFFNARTFTSVPIFFSPALHGDVFEAAYDYGVRHGIVSDLTILNMFMCRDKWEDLLVMPAHTWTGIHHSFLKTETRIREVLGEIISETGEEVNMVHGRWFDKSWVEGLRLTMFKYFHDCLRMSEHGKAFWIAEVDRSIGICLDIYNKYRNCGEGS